ncbi:MAG: DUF483 domain-containing protein [Bacillota bacterium]
MSVSEEQALRLLNDRNIQEQVKVEDLLGVAAGGRPVALLVCPADFPDGERMRQSIDEGFNRRYYGGSRRGGIGGLFDRVRYSVMRATMNPLRYKASLLRESYEEAIFDHPNYRAHRRWASELGLQLYERQLRPSLDEIYVIREQSTVGEVAALMVRREQIRREMLEEISQGDRPRMVFMPEERSPEYLERLGRLLSYPECCVAAYIDDVTGRVDSALRASNQLAEVSGDLEPTAYFAGAFFPCSPRCEAARVMGARILEALAGIDDRIGERMLRVFAANMRYVSRYPEVLKRRRQQMISKYMGEDADEER